MVLTVLVQLLVYSLLYYTRTEVLHDGPREYSGKTAEQNNLPHRLAETKKASHDGDSNYRVHQNRLTSISIRNTTPRDHEEHLRKGEK